MGGRRFLWYLDMDALSSRIWRDAVAVEEVDLSSSNPFFARSACQIKQEYRALTSLLSAPLLNEGF